MATVKEARLLDIINRVLIALGQAHALVAVDATSLSTNYHIKIAQFVNDILEEVEDAAQWRVLRTTATVTVSANAISGSLSATTERSKVWYVHNPAHERLIPLVYDVTNTSQNNRLWELDLAEIIRRDQDNSNASSGSSPSHFATAPTASGLDVYVWPRPTANVNIEADTLLPQARLETDSNAKLITVINVPVMPVVLGATWRAIMDRGDELGGNTVGGAEALYRLELAGAAAAEQSAQGADTLVPV